MINFRDISLKDLTFKWYCEECERKYEAVVECDWDFYKKNRATDKFVFNFFDCENTHKVFHGLDKGKDTIYTVLVKKEVRNEFGQ